MTYEALNQKKLQCKPPGRLSQALSFPKITENLIVIQVCIIADHAGSS